MRRGMQCQHCHMPERTHSWKGVHDPQTVRQGFAWTTSATRAADGSVSATIAVANVGAGHYLPTTTTPAAFLDVALVDAKGKVLRSLTVKGGARDLMPAEYAYAIPRAQLPDGDYAFRVRAWAPRQTEPTIQKSDLIRR
jgi:hypothetical protein